MAPTANPTRMRSPSFSGRDDPMCLLLSPMESARLLVRSRIRDQINVPYRTRPALRVREKNNIASRASLSFDEYWDHYEPPRAPTRINVEVRDVVTPKDDLEWEVGG